MPGKQTVGKSANIRIETSRVGKRGAIVVPARMRKKFGIEEGSLVIAEERDDGILIRPAVAVLCLRLQRGNGVRGWGRAGPGPGA